MSPQLKRRMKQSWSWKTRDSADLELFDVPSAVKEYLQNQVDQVLKTPGKREWSGWVREDLTGCTSNERQARKERLDEEYPGLLTGPHGAEAYREEWLPAYVLQASIPRQSLRKCCYATDLNLCVVLWHHKLGLTGLSFFNNHLDRNASFKDFVSGSAKPSHSNRSVTHEKRKGFIMATQYLYEELEQYLGRLKREVSFGMKTISKNFLNSNIGLSFRVGFQIGALKWQPVSDSTEQVLQVILEDLKPSCVQDFLTEQGSSDRSQISTGSASSVHERAKELLVQIVESRLQNRVVVEKSPLPNSAKERKSLAKELVASNISSDIPRIQDDEVVITVLGLKDCWTPLEVFSGMYGVVPMPNSWRIFHTAIEFFKPPVGTPARFYLKNQIVFDGPPLTVLGINYHGHLDVWAERGAIQLSGEEFDTYKKELNKATHKAFAPTFQDKRLGIELFHDILTDDSEDGPSIGHVLSPPDRHHGEGYRIAFQQASQELDSKLNANSRLFPYAGLGKTDAKLIEELGMVGRRVPEHVLRILRMSGAFVSIQEEAASRLRQSPLYTDPVNGFDLFQSALLALFPHINQRNIQLRDYRHSQPRVIYTPSDKSFAVRKPDKCDKHQQDQQACLCWVGLYLHNAAQSHDDKSKLRDDTTNSLEFWRTLMDCMKGGINTSEDDLESPIGQSREESRVAERKGTSDQLVDELGNSRDIAEGFAPDRLQSPGWSNKRRHQSKDKRPPEPTREDILTSSVGEDIIPCCDLAGHIIREDGVDSSSTDQLITTQTVAEHTQDNQVSHRDTDFNLPSQHNPAHPSSANISPIHDEFLTHLRAAEAAVTDVFRDHQRQHEVVASHISDANELRARVQELESACASARAQDGASQSQIQQLRDEVTELKQTLNGVHSLIKPRFSHSEESGNKRQRTEYGRCSGRQR